MTASIRRTNSEAAAAAPAATEVGRNSHAPERAAALLDARFRTLVGETAWRELPADVQRRFSKRLAPGETVVYIGRVLHTRLSWPGRILANVARFVGAPLPLTDGATGAAVVAVTEEPTLGGQTWTRSYARAGRFPQVVHSAKRFEGPTGLEEYIGAGLSMRLRVTVEAQSLVFRSAGYVVRLGGVKLPLPRWLEPGRMEIAHTDLGQGTFAFSLKLCHPVFGLLLDQLAHFRDI